FSGRTVALPDLHTIGACTGRMVAMVTPNETDSKDKPVRPPFNWARVLRHEIVHIFNLEQTDFLVPHWLTEGLAVSNEGFPRPPIWNQLLRERVPAGELFNLDNIDMGFIRFRSPLDWYMAYCQSQLYVEYIKERFGPQAIGQFLAVYREGIDTGSVIQKVCKLDKATFEKGYRDHLDKVVKTIQGRPREKTLGVKELEAAYKENPENPDIAARLAEALMQRDKA